MNGNVLLVTAGSPSAVMRRLARETYDRVIVEDAATAQALEAVGGRGYETLGELVSAPRDVYDPCVRQISRTVLHGLASALNTDRWTYEGVPLWDVVIVDFLWRYLDPLARAADLARELLSVTKPRRLTVSGSDDTFTRATVAVASTYGIDVVRAVPPPSTSVSSVLRARFWPYLGHLRECIAAARTRFGQRPRARMPFLLLNHTARNFAVMRPVLERLRTIVGDDGVLVVQVARHGSSEVEQSGFRWRELNSYPRHTFGLRALRAVGPIVRTLTSRQWRPHIERAGLKWEDVPLGLLADHEISFGLAQLVGNAAREIACARAVLSRERPAVVFLTDERSGLGRAFGLSARDLGIPSIMVQWGPIAPNSTWQAGIAADVAAVEGEVAAEVIRACDNRPGLEVALVGQPKYDTLLEEAAAADRAVICARYGLDSTRSLVLYASHTVTEASAPMRRNAVEEMTLAHEVQVVCRAGADLRGVQVAVKPHPNEGTTVHERAIADCGDSDLHLIPKNDSIYPLLFVADCVVTRQSTVGMEAVVLRKPVVIVNLSGRPDAIPYVQGGVAIGAYRPEEVRSSMERALYDMSLKQRLVASGPEFLRRYASQGQRSAADTLMTLALNLSGRAIKRAS